MQIAQGPQRHGQTVVLWPLLQCVLDKGASSLIQRRWATTSGAILKPCSPFCGIASLPDPHPIRRHLQQSSDAGKALPLLHQQHGLRPLSHTRVGICLD